MLPLPSNTSPTSASPGKIELVCAAGIEGGSAYPEDWVPSVMGPRQAQMALLKLLQATVNANISTMEGWRSRGVPRLIWRISKVAVDAARDEGVWSIGMFGLRFGTRISTV